MPLLALLTLASGELARAGFGEIVDPEAGLAPPEHLLWILDDYQNRRDAVWDLGLTPILSVTHDILALRNPGARLIPALLARGQSGMPDDNESVQRYLDNPNKDVRLAAIRALGQTGNPNSISRLLALRRDQDPDVRRAAVAALGGFADSKLLPELEGVAAQGPPLAAVAEASLRKIRALLANDFQAMVEAWIETPEYEDLMPVAGLSGEFLSAIVLDRNSSLTARTRATRLLAVGGGVDGAKRLAPILNFRNQPVEMRAHAAVGMGHYRVRPSVPLLVRALDEDAPELQRAAIEALGKIAAVEAFAPLIEHYGMSGGAFRLQIRLALWRIAGAAGDGTLEQTLRSNQTLGIQAVHTIDDNLALTRSYQPALVRAQLGSKNAGARRDAILLLTFLGGAEYFRRYEPGAIYLQIETLSREDRDPAVRELAALAVRRLSAPPGRP